MVHPCCGNSLQTGVSYLALFDIVWTFIRTIYHLNELLTTFDAWVIAGRIPAYGPITSSIDGYFVILYVAYFAMAILLIMGAHNDVHKCSIWLCLASILVSIQMLVFVVSMMVGQFVPFATIETEVPINVDSVYEENDPEFRVLKIPSQGVSALGSFYTLYEIWIVKLFMEELQMERDPNI